MMDMHDLLQAWEGFKVVSERYYRLKSPYVQVYTFRGPQYGHPSNFAALTFDCQPAQSLTFSSHAAWPGQLRADYCQALERAMGNGIVEGLLASTFYPYRGCSLILTAVQWDDAMSSEAAFYLTAKGAMGKLIADGDWEIA